MIVIAFYYFCFQPITPHGDGNYHSQNTGHLARKVHRFQPITPHGDKKDAFQGYYDRQTL